VLGQCKHSTTHRVLLLYALSLDAFAFDCLARPAVFITSLLLNSDAVLEAENFLNFPVILRNSSNINAWAPRVTRAV
jgi:hypothetical protein